MVFPGCFEIRVATSEHFVSNVIWGCACGCHLEILAFLSCMQLVLVLLKMEVSALMSLFEMVRSSASKQALCGCTWSICF